MTNPVQGGCGSPCSCGSSANNPTNPTTQKAGQLALEAISNGGPEAHDCSRLACMPKEKKGGGNGEIEDKQHHCGRYRLVGGAGYDCSQNSQEPKDKEVREKDFL